MGSTAYKEYTDGDADEIKYKCEKSLKIAREFIYYIYIEFFG
tara:strand:- start:591 stop:716 length:126 start_codon:yes stop_codon:yes gene_type:complete